MTKYDLYIEKKNESFLYIHSEQSILQELQDNFTFYTEGYKFMPMYKSGMWDGKIRLSKFITKNKSEIYYGLLEDIINFSNVRNYTYQLASTIHNDNKFNKELAIDFVNNQKITSNNNDLSIRDYQLKCFIDVINNKKQTIISPTSSGKSLIIYLICKYLYEQNLTGLIIIPNISLIHQLYADFKDYSSKNKWNIDDNVHLIYSGQDKLINKSIIISTFQSLHLIKHPKYFHKFNYVISDEVHMSKCKSIINIMSKCINAEYRIGTTGSLDNINANIKTIIGLFGPINKLITTKELIQRKQVSNLIIKCLILKYDKESAKNNKNFKYKDEIDYIISNIKRNNFIKQLAFSLKSNTLILTNYVESHGKILYELLNNSKYKGNRNIYFIHGGVEGEERERIRNIMEIENDSIIIATTKTMSTGVSIKNLHNVIFTTPYKKRIMPIQAIGRSLRLHDNKSIAVIYDIIDDFSYKNHKNFALQHFLERIKIYNEEKYDFKLYNISFINNKNDETK